METANKCDYKKVNSLNLVSTTFKHLDSSMVLKFYKQYIRSKLEYTMSIWRSIWTIYYVQDVEEIERVKRRVPELHSDLRGLLG